MEVESVPNSELNDRESVDAGSVGGSLADAADAETEAGWERSTTGARVAESGGGVPEERAAEDCTSLDGDWTSEESASTVVSPNSGHKPSRSMQTPLGSTARCDSG